MTDYQPKNPTDAFLQRVRQAVAEGNRAGAAPPLPERGGLPSGLSLITGPSKTGDIELRLVTGVHGPGEVHVVLVDPPTTPAALCGR